MSSHTLQQYLHEHIPLSRAMDAAVEKVDAQSVVLRAPLEPNINHRDTLFGGSASALAILAAWSLLHTRLTSEGMAVRLVIQRNTMEYIRPVSGEFTARASLPDGAEWSRFVTTLRRRGRGRIRVVSVLEWENEKVGELTGEFVAMQPPGD